MTLKVNGSAAEIQCNPQRRFRYSIAKLLVLIFFSIQLSAEAQSFWARTYGTDGAELSLSLQITSDGGSIVGGFRVSVGGDNYDLWILKLSSSGNIQWQKSYGGSGNDAARFIKETSDGGFIVAGQTDSFGAGSIDAWILKLDSGGNIQWQKTYGGGSDDGALSIQPTSDGGFIVGGNTDSFGAGDFDFLILKLDSSGNVEWQRTYGGSSVDFATSIQVASDGSYVVAGSTESFGAGLEDIWILKLDSSGNIQWQNTYGGNLNDLAYSIQIAPDGGFIVSGITESFGAGSDDFWILKLDSSGNIQWQKTYGSSEYEGASSVQPTSDGGYVVAGVGSVFNDENFWVLKLDLFGNIQWQKLYAGEEQDYATSVQQTSNGRTIVSGYTLSYGNGNPDFWILRLDSNGEIDSSCPVFDTVAVPDESDAIPDSSTSSTNTPAVTTSNPTIGAIDTTATVEEQCASGNAPPVALDDNYMTPPNTPLNVAAPGVLSNDSDDDGDALTAVLVSGPANGMLTLNANGSFNYTPNAGFVGSDTFTYVANDGTVNSNIATVTINVTESCLFCDDFEDGVLDPNWTYEKPEWIESGGFLIGTPTKKKAIAIAAPAFTGCTNCELEVSVRTAGGPFNKVWIYMHRFDKRTLTELLIKEENDKVILKQRINKTIVAKNNAAVTIEPNTDYVFRISYDGTQYNVFMNDTLLFSMTPGGSVPNATVGAAAKDTTVSIGQISVN